LAVAAAAGALGIYLAAPAPAPAAEFTDINQTLFAIGKLNRPGLVLFYSTKTKFEEGMAAKEVLPLLDKFVVGRISVQGRKDLMDRFKLKADRMPTILFLGPGGLELGDGIECTDQKRPVPGNRLAQVMQKQLANYRKNVNEYMAGEVAKLKTAAPAEQLRLIALIGDAKYINSGDDLLELAREKKTPTAVRQAAVKTLAAFDENKYWTDVVGFLSSEYKDAAKAAAEGLTLGSDGAAKALLEALKDENGDRRAAAAGVIIRVWGAVKMGKPAPWWKTATAEDRTTELAKVAEHVEKKVSAKAAKEMPKETPKETKKEEPKKAAGT
jgi:hypothetical protein